MDGSDGVHDLTLRGIVVPIEWDEGGEPLRIAILTLDEGEYEVELEGIGRQLMQHMQQEVLVRAVPARPVGSGRTVRVLSFARLEWKESEDELINPFEGAR